MIPANEEQKAWKGWHWAKRKEAWGMWYFQSGWAFSCNPKHTAVNRLPCESVGDFVKVVKVLSPEDMP